MKKIKRWFKKRFYLPVKYWRTRRHIIKNGRLRSLEEVFKLKWQLENDLLIAERNNFEQGKTIINAKLELLNYLLYECSDEQRYYKQ